MKSHARVVIVGGGVMGVGLLYHLALEGWSDIVLIEKGELTSGSTWHAAGQCPHFNGSLNMTKVHVYGTELYPKLVDIIVWHVRGTRYGIKVEDHELLPENLDSLASLTRFLEAKATQYAA